LDCTGLSGRPLGTHTSRLTTLTLGTLGTRGTLGTLLPLGARLALGPLLSGISLRTRLTGFALWADSPGIPLGTHRTNFTLWTAHPGLALRPRSTLAPHTVIAISDQNGITARTNDLDAVFNALSSTGIRRVITTEEQKTQVWRERASTMDNHCTPLSP